MRVSVHLRERAELFLLGYDEMAPSSAFVAWLLHIQSCGCRTALLNRILNLLFQHDPLQVSCSTLRDTFYTTLIE